MRKILLIIVIVAVAWSIPSVRNRVTVAALPLLEKLGPVADFAVQPAQRFKAKTAATDILRVIMSDASEGRALPDARSFQTWLQRRAPDISATDPWGQPWWLTRNGRVVTIGSNGIDGRRNTADDVTETSTLE